MATFKTPAGEFREPDPPCAECQRLRAELDRWQETCGCDDWKDAAVCLNTRETTRLRAVNAKLLNALRELCKWGNPDCWCSDPKAPLPSHSPGCRAARAALAAVEPEKEGA